MLNRNGVEAVLPPDAGCCGSLEHHAGHEDGAFAKARANVDAWTREIEGQGLDAILVTLSGCGTTVKDYGFMLRNDPAYAAKAEKVSSLTKDVSQYLAKLGMTPSAPKPSQPLTVAYHSACSLQHGQNVHREPKDLLAACGFTVKEVPEAHLCCGSAGTYNIFQPEIAGRLRDRKVSNIETDQARRDRRGQYRLHHADRLRHGDPGGASGRAGRLGDRRAGAGAFEGTCQCVASQQGERHGQEAEGKEKLKRRRRRSARRPPAARKRCKVRRSAARKPARKAKAKADAEAPRREEHASAAGHLRRAAADGDRSRGDADRATACAIPVLGAGRYATAFAGWEERELNEQVPRRAAPGNDCGENYSAATVCAARCTSRLTSASGVAVCSSMPQPFSHS